MILGVSDVEFVASQRHSLRVTERSNLVCAIAKALVPRPDKVLSVAIEVRDHYAVVIGISYEYPSGNSVRENLARE